MMTALLDMIRRNPDLKIEFSKASVISGAFQIRIAMGGKVATRYIYERFDDEAMNQATICYIQSLLDQFEEKKKEKENGD